jgi:hypothetical protein
VRSIPNVLLRGNVFHFRRAVPVYIRHKLRRTELTCTLKTCDASSAKLKSRALYIASEHFFKRLHEVPMLSDEQEPIVSGRSIAARYPDQWPLEMRADAVAALLDYETTGQLWKAVSRGEAPRPTAYRTQNGRREAIWALEICRSQLSAKTKPNSQCLTKRLP